ncbi:putative LPS biosynthesis protein WbpG [Aliarcobacter butzleri RM4018]|uniref:Putative LPS biosynthesis protein WbpG n=1 Tax=Aliarcobacter butzleri (strain RM4018) TaxID=367737 RepID=A8ESL1_ALIB4|nr:N-acetyl sugar amidotransferase [Aliarcobacter butzleri]ABV66935.1 putative LPS biosynthesis protein WbpG [Aliarcobacter butzleri RM4018]GGT80800.1 LPS biosynthesis protein WbpG [Aliarcobacter butzleri]SNV26103.1 Predicted ATPase of the PP-loop superfamily implicated in cell cycle control [Aliarcobacter butzleri]
MKKELDIEVKICSKCIYDERVSYISFDENGVCNYCHQLENLKNDYGTATTKGEKQFIKIIEQIKKDGKNKKYDCIIGVSGGTDSSYMLYLAKQWGLRPLAVHYDNTWNSAIATENIRKVLTALDIDLYTHVTDNKEADDIFRSFFYADVAEIEASTDLALAEVMYRAAWKYKVKYVLEGHSFMEEGITPVGRNYFDGKYIKSIHKMFGKLPMKSYPLMTITRFLFWSMFAKIQKIRPFWYIDYNKDDAKKFLEKEYDWKYYGGHHLENRMTAFFHSIYLPQKFNTDMRNNTLSALVRNGKRDRLEAWKEYNTPPHIEKDLLEYFKKRLELSDEEYEKIMARKPKSWTEYPTYKKTFELLRPLFKILAKANLVPMSFYLKYCFPMPKDDKK